MPDLSCSLKKIAFKSIGCRTNQEEMVSLRFRLQQEGYTIIEDLKAADIIIVNTCTVTSSTESKTRRLLNGLTEENPQAQILLTGCLAQQKPQELKELSSVKWVVGNNEKDQIPNILRDKEGVYYHPFTSSSPEFSSSVSVIPPAKLQAGFRTRFPVKIQEGCNYRCSYCIVPSVRGPSRSAEMDEIIATFRSAIESGYKEIVLTGTHIGQFGKNQNCTLLELLSNIVLIDGDFRVRLSSLDPRDITDDLLELVGNGGKICDHLHVSLQSLSEDVLSAMARPYSGLESMVKKLAAFRCSYPSAGLGADFIVGFPGETEENFLLTMERAKSIGFSYAHIFRYSARPGTSAAVMSAQVPEILKTERSDKFRNLINHNRNEFLIKNLTVSKKIIVESEYPVRGLTSNYIHVEVPGLRKQCNSWLDVSVLETECGRFHLAEVV